MSKVTKSTLEWAYKPFDIITNKKGDVGYIQETSVNNCQDTPEGQISYAVNWLVGSETKHAWFNHSELTYHCNLFVEIAQSACHPFGTNEHKVQSLFNNMNREDRE